MSKAKVYKEYYSGYGWYKLLYEMGIIETEYEPHEGDIKDVLPAEEYQIFREEAVEVGKKDGLEMRYFVLKPEGTEVHHKASREAIKRYAGIMQSENPILSGNLRGWVAEIEEKIDRQFGCLEIGQHLSKLNSHNIYEDGDYIICKMEKDHHNTREKVGVVDLVNGKQIGNTVYVENPHEISQDELDAMLDGRSNEFEVVLP